MRGWQSEVSTGRLMSAVPWPFELARLILFEHRQSLRPAPLMHLCYCLLPTPGSLHLRSSVFIARGQSRGAGSATRSRSAQRSPFRHSMQDGSAQCAVARQWGVDCMRTRWSALAKNSTLAAPVHALTVAGMTLVAALLTLRAARLFIRCGCESLHTRILAHTPALCSVTLRSDPESDRARLRQV